MRLSTLRLGIFSTRKRRSTKPAVRFDASAQTQDGERAQIRAWLMLEWQQEEDAAWRIRRWETESLEMLTRAHTLFAEVLDETLPRDEDRARARFSRHAELVRQSFSDSAFVAPHRYFTRQAFDRHPGISVVDIDADGYDDLYVAVRQGRNMLLHNGGDGAFTERAAQYGLDVEHHTAAALFADFDNDGDPDVFLGRTLAPSLYMVNEDGHFASRDLGDGVLPFLVASISAADYDGDGLLDVYFSTYAARMLLAAAPSVSRADSWGGALLADFLSADHARALYDLSRDRIGHLIYDAPGPPNVLLRNLGDGRFDCQPLPCGAIRYRRLGPTTTATATRISTSPTTLPPTTCFAMTAVLSSMSPRRAGLRIRALAWARVGPITMGMAAKTCT